MVKMAFEEIIKNAYEESENNCRFGDKIEEITAIQDYIKNSALVRFEHFDEEFDDVAGGVEFAAAFAFAAGEFGEEVFVDAAEDVVAVVGGFG